MIAATGSGWTIGWVAVSARDEASESNIGVAGTTPGGLNGGSAVDIASFGGLGFTVRLRGMQTISWFSIVASRGDLLA